MRFLKSRILITVIAVVLIAPVAYADEVMDAIKEAIDAYEEKAYPEAVESLDYAKQLIQQLTSEGLSNFLPQPLEGWQTKTAQSQNLGMLGGSAGIEKEYYKKGSDSGRKRITITIMGESPIFAGMMHMFNPAIAASDGGKLRKIKRNKAVVKYQPERQAGEIFVNVAKKYIVTVKGSNITEQDLLDYAEALDYKGLKSF